MSEAGEGTLKGKEAEMGVLRGDGSWEMMEAGGDGCEVMETWDWEEGKEAGCRGSVVMEVGGGTAGGDGSGKGTVWLVERS